MIMDRCVVEGCTSGLLSDVNKTRKNLLFKVPNDPDILDKWCTALGQILEPGEKVCSIHFKEDDILKNLSTFSKLEGQKTLMFKKRVKLKRNAVPISITVPDFLEIEESEFEIQDKTRHALENDVQNSDIIDESNTPQLSDGEGISEGNEKDDENQYILSEIDEDISIIREDNYENVNRKDNTKGKSENICKRNGVAINQVIPSSNLDDTINPIKKRGRKRKNTPKNELSQLDIGPNEDNFTQNKIRKSTYSYSPTKHITSFDELKYIVQQRCIRQQWCAKAEQNSVYFCYVNSDLSKVNCCLEVSENFKVNAFTADKVIAIYVATTDGVKSVAEIVEIMKVLEKKKWCLGPGVASVNRAADCIGAMPAKSISDSCSACIREKLDSLSHTRELANCRVKLEEARHKYECMRKKHHYANTQYEKLKMENKSFELKMEEIKKVAINELLNKLPPVQQCVMQYLIHSFFTPKCSLRYNDTWIRECLELRTMSPTVYEYLKHKDILPLPCADTLKKHKFKDPPPDKKEPKSSNPDINNDTSTLPVTPEVLPEAPEVVPDPLIVIKCGPDYEFPLDEPIDTTAGTLEIPESTEMPESTNPNDYDFGDLTQEYIVSDDVAYEVVVCSEPAEEVQY